MRDFRLGIIVRSDNTGLGYQTKSYYKWLKPDKVIEIDLSPLNGNPQNNWYSSHIKIKGIPNHEQIDSILEGIDVLLTAETPYNLDLYAMARSKGVKTICVENPEFYDHEKYPQYEMPDLIILPSVWLEDKIRLHAESRGCKVIQIHHPVDREEYSYRHRSNISVMHIAGKPAANDRNGTYDFLNAIPNGIITTQDEQFSYNLRKRYSSATIYNNIQNPMELYSLADILVMPRRYGGNCLPLNEALSCGIPVLMPNISPNNNLLPQNWLFDANITDSFAPRFNVDIYSSDIEDIRNRVEYIRRNIERESSLANEIAESISWKTLLPKYEEAIRSVL